jgi:hypothetical protein
MIQCWLHFFSYCKDNTDTVSFTISIDMRSNFSHFTYARAGARLGESTCSRHRCRTCGRVRRTSLEWVILHTYLFGGNLSQIVTPSHQALPVTWKPWQFSMIIERFAKSAWTGGWKCTPSTPSSNKPTAGLAQLIGYPRTHPHPAKPWKVHV